MLDLHPRRRLAVEGVHNIRDLGGYRTEDGKETVWRRVLRGDGLHRLGPEGAAALRAEGLSAVVDLRSAAELAEGPNPFAATEGVAYHHMPVFDDLAPAIRRGGATENPLLDFYQAALTGRGDALREILATIAAAPEGPAIFHCTAGKDRTGLVAALILGAVGVAREEIVADYALTAPLIAPLRIALLERTRAEGGDVEVHARFLACDAETMEAALDHLARRHGSIEGYLRDIGLDPAELDALRERLLSGG